MYKVTFKTGDYFKSQNMNTFFPVIPVIFNVTKQNQKLHIPLLLGQYGYSTYAAADDPSRYPANACAASAGVTLFSHHDVHA